VRAYGGETPSLIPGFKTVSMRDIIIQPGSKIPSHPMDNAMLCHMTEGELQIDQDEKTFTAKKNFVRTCNKGTKEQSSIPWHSRREWIPRTLLAHADTQCSILCVLQLLIHSPLCS
jgi:hypothetical protein